MKVLLREPGLELYFAGRGCWVSDPTKGYDFECIEIAEDFCRSAGMGNMEVAVLDDDDLCTKTILPASAATEAPAASP